MLEGQEDDRKMVGQWRWHKNDRRMVGNEEKQSPHPGTSAKRTSWPGTRAVDWSF